jgi:hypothetical protein
MTPSPDELDRLASLDHIAAHDALIRPFITRTTATFGTIRANPPNARQA